MKRATILLVILLACVATTGCGVAWWTDPLKSARSDTEIPAGHVEVDFRTLKQNMDQLAGQEVSFVCLITQSEDVAGAMQVTSSQGWAVLGDSRDERERVHWSWNMGAGGPKRGEVWRFDGRAEEAGGGVPGILVSEGERLMVINNPEWTSAD